MPRCSRAVRPEIPTVSGVAQLNQPPDIRASRRGREGNVDTHPWSVACEHQRAHDRLPAGNGDRGASLDDPRTPAFLPDRGDRSTWAGDGDRGPFAARLLRSADAIP